MGGFFGGQEFIFVIAGRHLVISNISTSRQHHRQKDATGMFLVNIGREALSFMRKELVGTTDNTQHPDPSGI